jgi:tRNA pseudouridine65 synthase
MLEILYQDEYIIAINKPSGLLVHKSFYARCKSFNSRIEKSNRRATRLSHRLDRKTSGVLLFALNKEVLKIMNDRFAHAKSKKNT